MKSMKLKLKQMVQTQQSLDRRGSTLLVVIALLAMLSLLGVVFYTFAAQEERSSQYFTEASLNEADTGLDADVLFNWGLEQLIKGPEKSFYNSALHGKRHSLLANMFGTDLHPYSGEGINVIMDTNGVVVVDQNYTGSGPSGNQDFLDLNLSYAAHGGPPSTSADQFPKPDVDYTAPDINNLFLAYNGYAFMSSSGTWRRVVIPSFLRPQYLRNSSTGAHVTDWYENDGSVNPANETTTKLLRPHPKHEFVDYKGVPSGTSRFSSSFPFQPLTNPGGNASLHGELGIFTNSFNSGAPVIELDVDNDNDGVVEGIWMDLDFPPIQNPNDPTKYILPLFSFTVYDLDGLINLNTAGNMRRPGDIDLNYNPSSNFFGEHSSIYTDKYLFLSRSNMGLSSPGEINPQWALNARPERVSSGGDLVDSASLADVFDQHSRFFGAYPYPHGSFPSPRTYTASDFQTAYQSTRDWRENSNMEYFFLNYGRPEFSAPSSGTRATKTEITDLISGRWGEPDRLYEAQRNNSTDNIFVVDTTGSTIKAFPRPGRTLIDDNGNRFEGGVFAGSLTGNRGNTHSFMHPLAYNGSGRNNKTGAGYRLANIGYNGWKGYEDFEIAGGIRYNSDLTFFKNSVATTNEYVGTLVDESDEITVDLEKVRRPYDEPYIPDDLAMLHMAQSDQDNTGVSSRLSELLPFNFGRASTVNARGESIRKKFTTMSWDRKQFGLSLPPGFREYEIDFARKEFPPFNAFPQNLNPFRPPLKELLNVKIGNVSEPKMQMKLNLNEVLVFDDTGTGRFVTTRPLTPHPGEDVDDDGVLDPGEDLNGNNVLDNLPATAINSSWNSANLPSYPPTNTQQQEFWARYDRQLMARDIYVLLYTFGGANDLLDYRSDNSGNVLYSDAQLKEMAQYAVNVVDALDPDDVITRFEYDKNLGDGWGLGDNPYQTGDDVQVGQRGVVYGVEAQKLTLGEFLAIKAPKVEDSSSNPVNHDATEYDDEKDRYFSYIELRNASTRTVSFANDGWQIRLEPRTDGTGISGDYSDLDSLAPDPVLNDTHKRRVTLRSGAVGGGGIYSIRSAGDNENMDPMSGMPRESYFRVDPNFSGGSPTYSTIVPRDITTPATDLITDDDANDFRMTTEADTVTPMSTRGDFLNGSNTDAGSTNFSDLTFVVRLMRRAHLGRAAPGLSNVADNDDNPWVEVDSMVINNMNEFALQESDMSTQIQTQLNQLQSFERSQPLYARGAGEASHAAGSSGTGYRANTVGTTNSNTGAGNLGADGLPGIATFDDDGDSTPDNAAERGWAFSDDRSRFDIWQPHFDRDFASVVELFSIPVIGPHRVTRDLATEAGWQTRSDTTTNVDRANDVRFAGIQKFLDPNGPDDTNNNDDNRWYRLLEFVEVPTRMHHQLGNPLSEPRVPGKLNLNTIRHPSVLAALLDDSDAFTMDMSGSAVNPSLNAPHLGGSNWWAQFIQSRDAKCYGINGLSGDEPHIPGNPKVLGQQATPFRGLHQTRASNVNDLRESTVYRSLPADTGNNNKRLLFEVATGAEHLGTAGPLNKVDFHTRNRLLSKITGNTTTRSNTFVVFLSVAYFEATGAGTTTYGSPVQIGGRLSPFDATRTANQPDYRGFFVIDRTRAEQAFEPSTGKFDHWKNLIRYRHTIQQ
ncbi:hypothetical protein [Gimesia chilikensis]|uniref:Uncharacterized protein n=1 Tax=Gimesia chilikensis TaxID=2605989 RepID=A0A517PWY7_9PLAN|nr:hypothetical protein [Gimesia chilikensis]QDT23834.1 hypothetical protein HG66A1_56590 [Gimesia chilikensis]